MLCDYTDHYYRMLSDGSGGPPCLHIVRRTLLSVMDEIRILHFHYIAGRMPIKCIININYVGVVGICCSLQSGWSISNTDFHSNYAVFLNRTIIFSE